MASRIRKQVRRSFDACWTCRRRRVACDGVFPACSPCQRLPIRCEGYSVRLVWVDGETGVYESHSRRTLDPLSTWAGQQPYNVAQLQHLTEIDSDDVCCECALHIAASNPFRILKPQDAYRELEAIVSPPTLSGEGALDLPLPLIMHIPSSAQPRMERMLLHHYVNQVAFLLMPVDSEANPWRSVYPLIAIQHSSDASRSLYNALLSQSAFHLSVLHAKTHDIAQQYKVQAMKHFSSALRTLRTSLSHQRQDFNACAAVLYTLAQIEGCYAPELKDWRKHFMGVSGLLTLFSETSPWIMSSDAWVISQSLALSFEIAYTGSGRSLDHSQITDTLLGSVSRVGQFGYTIGASSDVIQSISQIRRLAQALSCGESQCEVELQSGKILGAIGPSESSWVVTQTSENRQEYLGYLHRRIFRNAAIIYLYRTIYSVSPNAIRDHISEVLRDTIDFLNLKGGNVSLWPVFIAAVETSTQEEKDMVKRWLDYSCELGISNRHEARRIIEEVWKLRAQEAMLRDTQPENIAVDWREVQSQLNIDILLL